MPHGRLLLGTKRELLGEDGDVGKWFLRIAARAIIDSCQNQIFKSQSFLQVLLSRDD